MYPCRLQLAERQNCKEFKPTPLTWKFANKYTDDISRQLISLSTGQMHMYIYPESEDS